MKGIGKALAFLATVAGVALAVSTSALAVGAGSSPAHPQWRTSLGSIAWSGRLSRLYPGAAGDTELFAFTVTNAGQAKQRLSWVRASIPAAADGDAETARGADIRGCRAAWFTVSIDRGNRPLLARIAPGASYSGRVDLAMRDSRTNQDACRGASPAVTVAAG